MSYRRVWIAVFLFTLALINYMDRITLSFAIGPISREFGLGDVAKGYLFSSFLWAYAGFVIPMGLLADRFGSKKVAAWGMGIWSLATALTGLSVGYLWLLATRLVMGGGESCTNPSGAKVIREWIPAGERGMFAAAFNTGAYAGPAFCALVAGAIIGAWGWRSLFFIAGGVGFIWLAAWVWFYDRPEVARWLSEKERRKILTERNAGVKESETAARPAGLWRLMGTTSLWGVTLSQSCNTYSQYLFLTWLPSYLQNVKHLTLMKTGIYTAVPYIVAVLVCLGMARLSDRLLARSGPASGRRRNLIAFSMVLAAVVLAVPFIDKVWVLIVVICLAISGVATTTALNQALVNDLLVNPKDIAKAMAFFVIGSNLFALLAPIVTGYVISLTGSYDWAFGIAGILLVLGVIVDLTLTRKPISVQMAPAASFSASGAS
jgi:ACS family glucarate transporter-like MFS transporter